MVLLIGTSHLLRIEAPSAATAIILARALSEYHGQAVGEEDAWAVVIDLHAVSAGAAL